MKSIARTGDLAHLLPMDGSEKDAAVGGDARAATLALLARRAEGATICPSEVARAIAGAAGIADWRGEMAAVHRAVDAMAAEGLVSLSWKGEPMPVRDGPYRIARAPK